MLLASLIAVGPGFAAADAVDDGPTSRGPNPMAVEELSKEDIEMLKHLELLEMLDVLEKMEPTPGRKEAAGDAGKGDTP